MLKKIIIYVLIILGLFFIFLPKKHAQKREIIFWTLQLNAFDNYMNNIIQRFEKENPDIKIIWVDIPYSEGEKRVLASLLSPNMPDIVNLTADFSINLAQKGAIYELNENAMNNFSPQINKSLK